MRRHAVRSNTSILLALLALACGGACVGGCGKSAAPEPTDLPAASGDPTGNAAPVYFQAHAALGTSFHDRVSDGSIDASALVGHAATLDRVVVASRSPSCDFQVDFSDGLATKLPYANSCRALARALAADARRLIATGDLDGAARRIAAVLRMASQIGAQAVTLIELIAAISISALGEELVAEHPSLSGAAWKTDIQAAIPLVVAKVVDAPPAVLQHEAAMVAAWLRAGASMSGGMAGQAATVGYRPRMSAAEREDAAARLQALYSEAARVWREPQAASKLAALDERARRERISDLTVALQDMRGLFEKKRASLAATDAALRK